MNTKTITLIALALCLCLTAPALAVGPYYVSKYATAPTPAPVATDYEGLLHIETLCHHNLISQEVIVQRIQYAPYSSGSRISKEAARKLIPEGPPMPIQYLEEGGYLDLYLVSQRDLVTLKDGNGGSPEYVVVDVIQGQRTDASFIGHATSGQGTIQDCKKITIVKASYGSPEKMSDVTKYFSSKLSGNTISPMVTGSSNDWSWLLSFQQFYGTFPDPNIGTEKGIIVQYSKCGKTSIVTVPNVNQHVSSITPP